MGQYYKVINIDKKEYMRPNCGLKLMEWSYNRNPLILNLMEKLANEWKGDRVFVVGDYAVAHDIELDSYDRKTLENIEQELGIFYKKENGYYKSIYGFVDENFKEIELEKLENEEYKYIYNHNKKEYIDLEHCPLAWLYVEKGKYQAVRIAPISLALALGNGMGGGDYWGNNEELVGMFLNDVRSLEITKEPLNLDYKEVRPEFYEGEYIPYDEIKSEIDLDEQRLKIAKDIAKFIFDYDKTEFKTYYKNQKDATERIRWSLGFEAERKIIVIENIMEKFNDEEIKQKGNDLIEKIKTHIVEKEVRHSISECQYKLEAGVNNKNYINEVYINAFEKIKLKNIEDVVTQDATTIVTFNTNEKCEIKTNDVTSIKQFIENVKHIKKVSEEQKEVINYYITEERIPENKKVDGLYYYEIRAAEDEKVIEKSVWVDYSETLVTNKEILKDKEYIDYKELFENPKLLMMDDSDIAEKVKEMQIEDEEEIY